MAEKWTPERRRGLTRSALLDAAEEVFAAKGYHAAALDDIADAAGFTRGAIYSNFDGKEDLFLAVMERYSARSIDAFNAVFNAGIADWRELGPIWDSSVSGNQISLCLMLEFRLLAIRNEDVGKRLAEFERRMEQTVAAVLQERVDAGELTLSMSAAEAGTLLYAASQGLHVHQVVCDTPHDDLFACLLSLLFG